MKKLLFCLALACAPVSAPSSAKAQFLTGDEVKPILELTKANWVAVREWEGQDWLYFTHLVVYRCGMTQVRYFINKGKPRVRAFEPCYEGENPPFVIKMEGGHTPYDTHPLGAIETVTVEITLDNGDILKETFSRGAVLIP